MCVWGGGGGGGGGLAPLKLSVAVKLNTEHHSRYSNRAVKIEIL